MNRFHNSVITYGRRARDLFRIRYWARCIYCDEKDGPCRTKGEAETVRRLLDSTHCHG